MKNSDPVGALPAIQERARESAKRIVDAVEALLEEKSFDQLTMAEIAEAADLTPGAIYRRFENKEALLPHIFARYQEIFEQWQARVNAETVIGAAKSFDDAIEIVTRDTFRTFKKYAHIFRTMHLYGRLHPRERVAAGERARNPAFSPLDKIVAHYLGGARKRDANMMGHVLVSAVSERTLYPENLPSMALKLSDEAFVKNLALMLSGWAAR